jgi:hypothetical protein
MTFRKLKTRANSDGIVAAWSKMWTEDSPQPQIAGTVISWLPNQVKRTAGTKQMPFLGILQEAHLYEISMPFFLTGLDSSSDFAEFRAVRHGCFSIRLFTPSDSHPVPASKLLGGHCCSDRGACDFVLTGPCIADAEVLS